MTVSLASSAPKVTQRWRVKPTLAAGLFLLLLLLVAALFPHWIAPYSPTDFDYNAILSPPSSKHLFGTDNFGRDVFSRVVYGTRIDLRIALLTTAFPFVFGTLLGAFTAFRGGWPDVLVGRVEFGACA